MANPSPIGSRCCKASPKIRRTSCSTQRGGWAWRMRETGRIPATRGGCGPPWRVVPARCGLLVVARDTDDVGAVVAEAAGSTVGEEVVVRDAIGGCPEERNQRNGNVD
ncbi:hypothetical protein ABZP36_035982 [Zizania latifolia]